MTRSLSRRILLLLSLPAGLYAQDNTASVDDLSQNEVQTAFQILRRDYIRNEDLTFEELNRAALQGLLERLDFGAELVPRQNNEQPASPAVLAEFLAPGIAYLRPETMAEGEGKFFTAALQELVGKSARHLILDLRAGGQGSFDEAAQMLECFIPEGDVMFKLRQIGAERAELFVSRRVPLWAGSIVLLLDGSTGNAAETLAAVLEQRQRALIIGTKTKGATVRYTELELGENIRLRYASAEMLLPDDTSVFKKGLGPAFEVQMAEDSKRKVFEQSRGKSLKPFVVDRVRSRYNEAALVHGGNPELDDYVRKSKGEKLPGDEGQLRDIVVQRAVDLLMAEQFIASAKLPWQPFPAGNENGPEEAAHPANEESP